MATSFPSKTTPLQRCRTRRWRSRGNGRSWLTMAMSSQRHSSEAAVDDANATHFQVYDTRKRLPVQGAECMEYEPIAENIAFRLNLRSRAASPRYVLRRVNPSNLPILGT